MIQLVLAVGAALAGTVGFDGDGHAYHPTWSSDGRYLAFEVNRYAGDVDLYVAEMRGERASSGVKVTLPGGSNVFGGSGQVVVNPAWHRDGYVVFEGANQGGRYRIYYRQDAGGSASELIATAELAGHLTFPTVSPDGRTLAFVSDATGSGDIRMRDTQTNKLTHLTRSPAPEMFPTFSSDGSKVLFTRKSSGLGEDVYEVSVSTSAESMVVGGPGDQTRPVYGRNGTIVYFDGSRGEEHWDLVVYGAGTKRTIAKDVRLPLRSRPAISPDGRWVAYTFADPARAGSVMLARVDDLARVEIKTSFTGCGEPAIGVQDGKTMLAFTALPSSGSTWRFLHVMDITSRL